MDGKRFWTAEAETPRPQRRFGGAELDATQILDDLEDNPSEALTFALAHCAFELGANLDWFTMHMEEADHIRGRLRALGFDIFRLARTDRDHLVA